MFGITRFAGFRLIAGVVAFAAYHVRGATALLGVLVFMLAFETESLHIRLRTVEEDADE